MAASSARIAIETDVSRNLAVIVFSCRTLFRCIGKDTVLPTRSRYRPSGVGFASGELIPVI